MQTRLPADRFVGVNKMVELSGISGGLRRASVYATILAPVAQWIRHLTTDQAIAGSTPAGCVCGVEGPAPP